MIEGKDFLGKVLRCLINFKMLNTHSNEDVRLAVGSMAVEFLRKDASVRCIDGVLEKVTHEECGNRNWNKY